MEVRIWGGHAVGQIVESHRLLDVYGRGGFGVVYRAVELATGRVVAFKTAASMDESGLSSLRREIEILSHLPNLDAVRLLANGVYGGVPWYTMELYQAPTLRDIYARLSSAASEPQAHHGARRSTLEILALLCGPLSILHRNGVVHGDVKPENILVRRRGAPVVIDFGAAAFFAGVDGRERMDVGGRVRGTPAYMAPEQIRGATVDARADLYALGCNLYECLTGAPPFTDRRGVVNVEQKLRAYPTPPSSCNASVTRALDELCLELLSPRPEERLGYAEDVALRLASMGCVSAQVPQRAAQVYFHRSRLFGRSRELSRLSEVLDAVERGEGRIVYLSGRKGSGKTRLLMELATMASWRGFRVLVCGGDPTDDAGTAFRALLESAEAWRDERAIDRGRRPREAESDERALACAGNALFALADVCPVHLALDGAQWTDRLVVKLVDELLRRGLSRRRVLVTATCTAEAGTPALLTRVSCALALAIAPLGAVEIEAMVREMLALHEVNDAALVLASLVPEGYPSLVGASLRAAVADGLLFRDRVGRWQLRSVAALGAARIDPFSEKEKEMIIVNVHLYRADGIDVVAFFVVGGGGDEWFHLGPQERVKDVERRFNSEPCELSVSATVSNEEWDDAASVTITFDGAGKPSFKVIKQAPDFLLECRPMAPFKPFVVEVVAKPLPDR